MIESRAACPAPRGIAFDAAARNLLVACASGELVTLPAEAATRASVRSSTRSARHRADARRHASYRASRAPSCSRSPTARSPCTSVRVRRVQVRRSASDVPTTARPGDTSRARDRVANGQHKNGGAVMLHQGARNGEIRSECGRRRQAHTAAAHAVAAAWCSGDHAHRCDGEPAATRRFEACSPSTWRSRRDGSSFAIVQAGEPDPAQPRRRLTSASALLSLRSGSRPGSMNAACSPPRAHVLRFPGTSHRGRLGHRRGRWSCKRASRRASSIVMSFVLEKRVDLGGDSVYDTGHELFHRDAGAGIACASCHAEGGDDGHVWQFSDIGPRRTQSVNVGLEGTAPFHWSGDQADIADADGRRVRDAHGRRAREPGAQRCAAELAVRADAAAAQRARPTKRSAARPGAVRGRRRMRAAVTAVPSSRTT